MQHSQGIVQIGMRKYSSERTINEGDKFSNDCVNASIMFENKT